MKRLNPRWPDRDWATKWAQWMFQFWDLSPDSVAKFDADGRIAFLRHVKGNGVETWQWHQAAITAARHLEMTAGSVAPEIKNVIRILGRAA